MEPTLPGRFSQFFCSLSHQGVCTSLRSGSRRPSCNFAGLAAESYETCLPWGHELQGWGRAAPPRPGIPRRGSTRLFLCSLLTGLVVRMQVMKAGKRSKRPLHREIHGAPLISSVRTSPGRREPEELASTANTSLCCDLALFAFCENRLPRRWREREPTSTRVR